jgi:Holliday junction resolvase-like predicted endonuclease
MSSEASAVDLKYGKAYERAAAEVLVAKLWPGAEVRERKTFAAIDFDVVFDGQVVAFLEVKRRRLKADAYPDTAVHWSKYIAGRNLMRYFGVRALCLVVWNDRVGTFYVDEKPDCKEDIARNDRDGVGYPHAFYSLERMVWHDELLPAIEAATAAAALVTPAAGG